VSEEASLRRQLSLWDATAIGLGTMIGGGIFVLPPIAAGQAGPASMVSFALAGVVSLLTGLSVAELANEMPVSGGAFHFIDRALGRFLGTVVGLGMWVGLMFATAFYAIGFARYLAFFHGGISVPIAAAVLAVALTLLNYRGASEAGSVQTVIVYALLVLIVAFLVGGTPAVDTSNFLLFNPEGWGAMLATTGTVYVTFLGFQVIATAGKEIQRPARNLPLSILISVVVPTILYVAVMAVSTGVLTTAALAGSTIPVADVAREFAGPVGAIVMATGAVLATISSANASVLSASRISYAMGTNILSPWLCKLHPTYECPHRAILVTGAGITVLTLVGVGLATLAEVAGFVYLFAYALANVALIRLRRSDPDYDPDFRIPGILYPTVPVLGFAASIFVMFQMQTKVVVGGLAFLALSALWYLVSVRRKAEPTPAEEEDDEE
jgi:amino acid transporter